MHEQSAFLRAPFNITSIIMVELFRCKNSTLIKTKMLKFFTFHSIPNRKICFVS